MESKKAQLQMTFNIGMFIPRLLFLIFVTLSIIMLIRHFVVLSIDVSETEGRIIINRFIYSPNCIAYVNNINRPYPGIIDLSRFNQKTLEECIYYGPRNDYASAKLVLLFLDNNDNTTVIYNPVGYEAWLPRANMAGPGGAKLYYDSRYVLVSDGNELKQAVLNIEVIIPNY